MNDNNLDEDPTFDDEVAVIESAILRSLKAYYESLPAEQRVESCEAMDEVHLANLALGCMILAQRPATQAAADATLDLVLIEAARRGALARVLALIDSLVTMHSFEVIDQPPT